MSEKDTSRRSPLPWKADMDLGCLVGADGGIVCGPNDSELILKAVNSYEVLRASQAALVEAASWATVANATLQEYEKDYGEPLADDVQIGRISESRGSASFRVRLGHIRRLAAALAAALAAQSLTAQKQEQEKSDVA